MVEPIDEATIIAWVDGELDDGAAARVIAAVAQDPALAVLAERHRRIKACFAAAFDQIGDEAVAMPVSPPASVHSLEAARKRRDAGNTARSAPSRWAIPGAIAASLLVGLMTGYGMNGSSGLADSSGALALSPPIATALDQQLAGEPGTVRIALSYRDRNGDLCRSFIASHIAGVACRANGGWQLRYGSAATASKGDYRMAGTDDGEMAFIQSVIAGEPLDRAGEVAARAKKWTK
ncbi:hypothetical protein [uncultured Sphingomonas sp.]|uniref:hypothetical protein n=1 Tax=uncultured Sphingomonas sp. TaxID=158754 RepID=UPI002638B54D|nr:hypothetical protein [uncultured Sphingomonas sp.]